MLFKVNYIHRSFGSSLTGALIQHNIWSDEKMVGQHWHQDNLKIEKKIQWGSKYQSNSDQDMGLVIKWDGFQIMIN